LEGSVELVQQFVAALGLAEHGAGIEPQHRVHGVAVSAGCFGKRHSGSQAGPDREVAQGVGGDPAEARPGTGRTQWFGDVA